MKTFLYYDCFSGISGDMNLAAMIDLGVSEEYLRAELAKLHLDGYELVTARDQKHGIFGTRVDVNLLEEKHHHDDHHQDHHHHDHRNLHDITHIINHSTLPDNVKTTSLAIFQKIAEAEAKVHGTTIDKIHFHEVGAVDSIVDIVGAAICIDFLKPDIVYSSPVELGGGFVKCAHGTFPVPAPATVEILKGIPVKSGAVQFETTTPTGAAILAALVNVFGDKKDFTIEKTGYGIGHRDTEIPNVLRVFTGTIAESHAHADHCLLECNVDDMSPEVCGYLLEKLIASGASDVYYTPIVMKKSRPALMLSVLCHSAKEEEFADIILRESSTFGLRKIPVGKLMLDRKETIAHTSLGDVRIKTGFLDGKRIKAKPEYEDCKRIAEEKKIPLTEVYDIIRKEV